MPMNIIVQGPKQLIPFLNHPCRCYFALLCVCTACGVWPSSLSGLGRRKRKSAPARIVFDDFAAQYLDIG